MKYNGKTLTAPQQRSLVLCYLYGPDVVSGNAWSGLAMAGLLEAHGSTHYGLNEPGRELARTLLGSAKEQADADPRAGSVPRRQS